MSVHDPIVKMISNTRGMYRSYAIPILILEKYTSTINMLIKKIINFQVYLVQTIYFVFINDEIQLILGLIARRREFIGIN